MIRNNNYNDNDCVDIKLNEFIFNTAVSIHLFTNKYNNIKDILEYSLLSKRCFKIFQNLIISSPHKFIFPINNFIKYIISNNSNNNNNNNTTYINQLIQYKDIETIKVLYICKSISSLFGYVNQKNNNNKKRKIEIYDGSKSEIDQDDQETVITQIYKNIRGKQGYNDGSIFLKRFLNHYCPCLKETTVISEKIKRDTYIRDDFFKFNKLSLYWDHGELPISNDDNGLNPPNEVEVYDTNDENGPYLYEYSFSFISNYNPTKVYISNHMDNLKNMNNILNFKSIISIKSIHFDNHITPTSFITKVFQSSFSSNSKSNLRSLFLMMNHVDDETLLNSEIHSNKTIKKLILDRIYNSSSMITKFLQLVQSNSTISTLGLHYFNIENSDQLSPLIQMKNINTLYCIYKPKILYMYLDHCNYNSNIKKLVIYDRYGYDDYTHDEMIGIFENFIKNNNSSLEIIKFKFVDSMSNQSLIKSLNDLLISNNYNNNEIVDSKHLKLLCKLKKQK